MRTVSRQAPRVGPTLSLGVVFCPPWLLSPLSPASWPPLPRERLKPHAIDIRVNIDPVHWFLSPPRDTRSSLYLEDAATEFQVQGAGARLDEKSRGTPPDARVGAIGAITVFVGPKK